MELIYVSVIYRDLDEKWMIFIISCYDFDGVCYVALFGNGWLIGIILFKMRLYYLWCFLVKFLYIEIYGLKIEME